MNKGLRYREDWECPIQWKPLYHVIVYVLDNCLFGQILVIKQKGKKEHRAEKGVKNWSGLQMVLAGKKVDDKEVEGCGGAAGVGSCLELTSLKTGGFLEEVQGRIFLVNCNKDAEKISLQGSRLNLYLKHNSTIMINYVNKLVLKDPLEWNLCFFSLVG